MLNFLEQFVHYMCSRCITNIPHHTIQDKTGGRHSHNGEILDLLAPVPPTSDRILAAYHVWQAHTIPSNLQADLARAYNTAGRTVARTAPERALRTIIDNISDVWIRHGQEQAGAFAPRLPFPDPESRIAIGTMVNDCRDQGWFAIDLDSTPFAAFEQHPVELTSGYPWTYTVGLLPMTTFQRYRGTLHHPADRDHLYARCNIPAKHWVFLYRDFDDCILDAPVQLEMRNCLLNSGAPVIHIDEYRRLIQLYRHLREYTAVPYSRGAVPR